MWGTRPPKNIIADFLYHFGSEGVFTSTECIWLNYGTRRKSMLKIQRSTTYFAEWKGWSWLGIVTWWIKIAVIIIYFSTSLKYYNVFCNYQSMRHHTQCFEYSPRIRHHSYNWFGQKIHFSLLATLFVACGWFRVLSIHSSRFTVDTGELHPNTEISVHLSSNYRHPPPPLFGFLLVGLISKKML